MNEILEPLLDAYVSINTTMATQCVYNHMADDTIRFLERHINAVLKKNPPSKGTLQNFTACLSILTRVHSIETGDRAARLAYATRYLERKISELLKQGVSNDVTQRKS